MLGGFLIFLDRRIIGAHLCIIGVVVMIALQDNPWLLEHVKPKPKNMKMRYDELARHVSLIGGLLYLMAVPPVVDPEPKEHKSSKKVKTN